MPRHQQPSMFVLFIQNTFTGLRCVLLRFNVFSPGPGPGTKRTNVLSFFSVPRASYIRYNTHVPSHFYPLLTPFRLPCQDAIGPPTTKISTPFLTQPPRCSALPLSLVSSLSPRMDADAADDTPLRRCLRRPLSSSSLACFSSWLGCLTASTQRRPVWRPPWSR